MSDTSKNNGQSQPSGQTANTSPSIYGPAQTKWTADCAKVTPPPPPLFRIEKPWTQ